MAPVTGWGLTMQMDLNNILNLTLPAGHVSADPHITMEDGKGTALANIEWRVTDNSTPAQTSNAVLLNGVPVLPTTYGVVPINYFGMPGGTVTANYGSPIAVFGDHTEQSFNFVLAARHGRTQRGADQLQRSQWHGSSPGTQLGSNRPSRAISILLRQRLQRVGRRQFPDLLSADRHHELLLHLRPTGER